MVHRENEQWRYFHWIFSGFSGGIAKGVGPGAFHAERLNCSSVEFDELWSRKCSILAGIHIINSKIEVRMKLQNTKFTVFSLVSYYRFLKLIKRHLGIE